MALRFTTTKETTGFVKALVYGEAGAGKTKLCATAPSPLIISAESGLLSLADYDIPVIEVSTVADCHEALSFVQSAAEAKNFQSICLDSISDIAEVMLTEYKKQFSDARQAYGQLADDMGVLIRAFRDLPGRHVYFTAKQGNLIDEYSGLVKYAPMMPGKTLTNGLPFFFDEVMALRIHEDENGKLWRYLQTAMTVQCTAKDRSGKLDAMEKPDLGHVFNKILGSNIPEEVKNEKVTEQVKTTADTDSSGAPKEPETTEPQIETTA